MYNIRLTTQEDYETLCGWWKFWRFPAPPQDCLPNNGEGGVMILKDDIPVCAGFLYMTNSKLCWIEYIVSNPQYKEKDRKEVIRLLIHEISGLAQRKGFKAIFTSVKNQPLIKHYEACGYIFGSNNTTEMILNL